MSTRANVIIKDENNKLFFYRHSDGYPEGTLPTLKKFMQAVVDGKIRNNVQQASGWLIMFGAMEYNDLKTDESYFNMMDWKVGAFEPTTGIHGDIEFLYELDLKRKCIIVMKADKTLIDKIIF